MLNMHYDKQAKIIDLYDKIYFLIHNLEPMLDFLKNIIL